MVPHGLLAIGHLAHDHDLRSNGEHDSQSTAGGAMVVDQHSRLHHHLVCVLDQASICQTFDAQGAKGRSRKART